MQTKINSSYISDGKVVAMNQEAVYVYKHELSEKGCEKLLKKLETHTEINLDHWETEWVKSACGA